MSYEGYMWILEIGEVEREGIIVGVVVCEGLERKGWGWDAWEDVDGDVDAERGVYYRWGGLVEVEDGFFFFFAAGGELGCEV